MTGMPSSKGNSRLALAAVGIVFGDIGTSPLYTMSTVFDPSRGLALDAPNIVGVVSLVLWSLMVVVTLKYVILIMRADNRGEGGIMALLALAATAVNDRPRLRKQLLVAGVFGAALFYGDGVITPAISVLSAVEGLKVASAQLQPFVVPLSVAVLVGLFLVQRRGTGGIGSVFGPVMVAWFLVLAISGGINVLRGPSILTALNPLAGIGFLVRHGWLAFVSLGAVVLALTGAEALYADMGHFGATPIRMSWFGLVYPALAVNYLGQGALLLGQPGSVDSPFFHLFAPWLLYPMTLFATVATVIASQAVISGAYSMTKQAIQLGFLPRMKVVHTSERQVGQVYVPAINWTLLLAVICAVVAFGSSTALGSAYGIAVTGTMMITTYLTFFVVRYAWHYNLAVCVLATGFFLVIDVAFFAANLLKVVQGGWFPLLVGAAAFVLMSTWKRGREILFEKARALANAAPLQNYVADLLAKKPLRAPGTAAFLTLSEDTVPRAFANNLEHNHVIHERVLFVTVTNLEVPYVPVEKRLLQESLGENFYRIVVTYGFKDEVDLPASISLCTDCRGPIEPAAVSYFLSHATVIATPGPGMWLWREKLFATMSNNVGNVAAYLRLPSHRIIELGTNVEI